MDAGIGSFGSSGVTPVPPVLETAQRAQPPKQVAPDRAQQTPLPLDSQRTVELDAATKSLVYRTIDVASGLVVKQTPDESRLKLRAYIDGVAAERQPQLIERVA